MEIKPWKKPKEVRRQEAMKVRIKVNKLGANMGQPIANMFMKYTVSKSCPKYLA